MRLSRHLQHASKCRNRGCATSGPRMKLALEVPRQSSHASHMRMPSAPCFECTV